MQFDISVKNTFICRHTYTKVSTTFNSRPVSIDFSPSPLRLSLKKKQRPKYKFQELYPNSDVENYSDHSTDENPIGLSNFKRIKKTFKNGSRIKLPRLFSNDYGVNKSNDTFLNSSFKEESVFINDLSSNLSDKVEKAENYKEDEDEYYLESYCDDDKESYDILTILENKNKNKS